MAYRNPTKPTVPAVAAKPAPPKVAPKPAPAPVPAPAPKGVGKFQTFKKDVKLGKGRSLGFTRGRGYYARPATQPKPTAPARGARPPRTGPSEAELIVNAALAPLLEQYKAQQAETDRRQQAEQAALQGFTGDLMKYLVTLPGQVSGDYGAAAGQAQSTGAGVAAGLEAANPNAQVQGDLAAINAPESQRESAAGQLSAAYPGAAAVLLGAGLRNRDFLREVGGARTTLAGKQPGIQSLAGIQAFKNLLYNQGSERQKLASMLAEIQAKRPGLLLDTQRQLSSERAAQQAAQERAQYDRFKMNLLAKEFGLKTYKTKADVALKGAKLKADQEYRAAMLGQRGASLKLQAARLDQQSRQWAAKFGLDQRKLAVSEWKATHGPKRGGFTANQLRQMRSDAYDSARDGILGWTDTKTGQAYPPIKPVDVLRDLIGHGIPFSIAVRAVARFFPPARNWYGKPKGKGKGKGK
jgi:hypothetical protein